MNAFQKHLDVGFYLHCTEIENGLTVDYPAQYLTEPFFDGDSYEYVVVNNEFIVTNLFTEQSIKLEYPQYMHTTFLISDILAKCKYRNLNLSRLVVITDKDGNSLDTKHPYKFLPPCSVPTKEKAGFVFAEALALLKDDVLNSDDFVDILSEQIQDLEYPQDITFIFRNGGIVL